MRRAACCVALWCCAQTTHVQGQDVTLPVYQRVTALKGALRLEGSSVVAMHARAWAQDFQRLYPETTVTVAATNSGAAITAMLRAAATLGMTSRPITPAERDAMARQYGLPPFELKVAVDAVAIYVHKDNPIKSITLAQLERIYGAAPKLGPPLLRWGDLGLANDWAERRITTVGFAAGRGAYDTMRDLVLRGGNFNANTSAEPVSSSVPQAVAVDPGAIGYASAYYHTLRTKLLPLQANSGELSEPNEADRVLL